MDDPANFVFLKRRNKLFKKMSIKNFISNKLFKNFRIYPYTINLLSNLFFSYNSLYFLDENGIYLIDMNYKTISDFKETLRTDKLYIHTQKKFSKKEINKIINDEIEFINMEINTFKRLFTDVSITPNKFILKNITDADLSTEVLYREIYKNIILQEQYEYCKFKHFSPIHKHFSCSIALVINKTYSPEIIKILTNLCEAWIKYSYETTSSNIDKDSVIKLKKILKNIS